MKISDTQLLRHHYFRIRYTELNELYLAMSIRSLGGSLIAVFAPIYLYLSGVSIRSLMLYFLMMNLSEAFFEYFSARSIKKFGPKHLIAMSMPIQIIHFWLLYTIPTYHWPLWIVGFMTGFMQAIFWQPYHYDFSRAKHRKKSAREVSKIHIALAILGAIGPLIGGFVASRFGIGYVFATVIVLIGAAIIPLFKTSEKFISPGKFDLKKLKILTIKRDLVSYIGNGWEVTVGTVFWPLFIFFIVKSYETVGALTSIALLISIVITYFVGKGADHQDRQKYIKYGGTFNGLVYLLQTLAYTAIHVMMANLARSFAQSVFTAPFTSEYYLHADEESRSEYMYAMETAIDLGRIFLFGLMYILTFVLATKWVLVTALVFGGIGSFLTTLMPPAKCEICQPIKNKTIKLTPMPVKR